MSALTLRRLSETEYENWDQFVAGSPQGTVFNTSRWAGIIGDVFGVPRAIYGALRHDNLVGGISLFHKKRYGLKVMTRIPLTPYSGILFSPSSDEKYQKLIVEQREIAELILKELENQFQFLQLSFHHSVQDLRALQWRGWSLKPQYTLVSKIENIEKLWEGLSSSLRRKINRAQEKDFTVIEKDNPSLLLALQEESYRRNGLKPVLPYDIFERYCAVLIRSGLLRIYSISDSNGNVHSERAVVLWNGCSYDWIAGTDAKWIEGNATHLLVWEMMKRLSAGGYGTFDFLGANTPHIVDFKQSFGGELRNYYEATFYSSSFSEIPGYAQQKGQISTAEDMREGSGKMPWQSST